MKRFILILSIVTLIMVIPGCSKNEGNTAKNNYEWAGGEQETETEKNDPNRICVGGAVYDKNKKLINPEVDGDLVYDGNKMEFYVRIENDGEKKIKVCMTAMINGVLQPYTLENEKNERYGSTVEINPDGSYDYHIFIDPVNVSAKETNTIKFVTYTSLGAKVLKEDSDARGIFGSLGKVNIKAADEKYERTPKREADVKPSVSVEDKIKEYKTCIATKKNDVWQIEAPDSKIKKGKDIFTGVGAPREYAEEYSVIQYVDGELVENINGGHQMYFKGSGKNTYYFKLNKPEEIGEHILAIMTVPAEYKKNDKNNMVIEDYEPAGDTEQLVEIVE